MKIEQITNAYLIKPIACQAISLTADTQLHSPQKNSFSGRWGFDDLAWYCKI